MQYSNAPFGPRFNHLHDVLGEMSSPDVRGNGVCEVVGGWIEVHDVHCSTDALTVLMDIAAIRRLEV